MPPTRTGNMSTTGTFHPFPRLPWELRAMIWEFTIQPREVDVRVVSGRIQGDLRIDLRSVNKVPAILQVCKQSRSLGLYEQAFAEIPFGIFDFQRKYVWVNWEYDTIRAGMTELYYFRYESIQTSIQRLDIDRSRLYPWEIKYLQNFVKLKKLYIHGDSYNFRGVFRKNPLPCGQKDIILHDIEGNIEVNSFDWDEIWDNNLGYMATLWGGNISVDV